VESRQDAQGLKHSPCEKLRNQGWLSCGQKQLQDDLTAAPQNLWEGHQKDGAGLFKAGHGGRMTYWAEAEVKSSNSV